LYKILDNLATHGIGESVHLLEKYAESQIGWIDGFRIIDVRMLNDYEGNSDKDYKLNVARVTSYLECNIPVVICCDTGQSRSNAIALGVLVQHFKMGFYDAWELLKKKAPICNIDPSHILALKKTFKVKLP
jgi:predicted protein tyrosine phosphatase